MMKAIRSYLALRRTAGFQLKGAEYKLRAFCRFARRRGDTYVRAETVIAWATEAPSLDTRCDRLATVNRFARHARIEDRRHEIVPVDAFGALPRRRIMPFIFSPEEIRQLVAEAWKLGPPSSLRPRTCATLYALLAATGLRISEALNLRLDDITDDGLLIRETKFQKSRLVPLHDTAMAGLNSYLRHRLRVETDHDYVFISLSGARLNHQQAFKPFRLIVDRKIRPAPGRSKRRPRIHDLRHTFAVRSLEACDRKHVDRHMLALSTYLGHAEVSDTYWYLEATPHLLRQIGKATQRLVTGGGR